MAKSVYFTILLFFLFHSLQAQITITPDHPNHQYAVGETIVFTINSPQSGVGQYAIRYSDISRTLEQASINLVAGQDKQVIFTPQEPCFLVCSVQVGDQSGISGASVSPFDLQPLAEEPADFDAFWNGVKAELAQVPIDPQVTLHSQTTASKTYRVNLGGLDGRRVYGYISVPTTSGPFGAILQVPAYGSFPGNAYPVPFIAENMGMIAMSISIHNAEPDTQDPNAYQPDNPLIPEENYYRYALSAAVRAIDYIFSRSDFDGNQLAVYGISQGGGLAISTAGLDQRVKLLINLVPALSRHSGLSFTRPSGHPHYLHTARFSGQSPSYEIGLLQGFRYYDTVNFAKRFKGPSLSVFGYIDPTCPPATGFTANNQLIGTKMIVHSTEKGHDAYFADQFDWYRFIRGHFSGFMPYFPPPEDTPWYVLDVGTPQSTTIGTNINLQANLTNQENLVTNLPITWQKVKGPGSVHFSSLTNYTTTARFNQAGTYLLRAVVKDETQLATDKVWYDIIDYVEITVN